MDFPQIAYWMDKPLSELPRRELEQEFVIAHRRIKLLEDQVLELSCENVHLLSEIARGRLSSIQPKKRGLANQISHLFFGRD
jgi:hypothetical protein